MNVCHLECDEPLAQSIRESPTFAGAKFTKVELPLTALNLQIDLLVVGPRIGDLLRLVSTISDWEIPPVALCILQPEAYESERAGLECHPRVGRSIHFCENTAVSIDAGLDQILAFFRQRQDVDSTEVQGEHYTLNNVSPRWLFHSLMEHLDEFIYFKDRDSRFLAVSRYLTSKCHKDSPDEVLGLTDFEFFDEEHSREAYVDERKIATGEVNEVHKEEHVTWGENDIWVQSRKMPLRTRSGFLAGSFGISRDITEQKAMHAKIEANHEYMQEELLLARQLQHTLLEHSIAQFVGPEGEPLLEVASKYLPSFHLSGDFYALFQTPDGGAGVLVADVMGHGVRAAMVTAMIQVAMQQLRKFAGTPKTLMQRLNAMLHRSINQSGHTLFATAIYGHLDFESGRFTYTHAGGRHGVFLSEGRCEALGASVGPALGLLPDTTYEQNSLVLNPEDRLVLYTDGLTEASSDVKGVDEFGEDRLKAFLLKNQSQDLAATLESLLKEVTAHRGGLALEDDLCLLALRIPSPASA